MSRIECRYESEILDAVASGRWPDRLGAELHDHISSCNICSELAMVSAMYRDDYASAMDEVRVPSAGLVWWKSELRARREAVRVASRPITLVTGIAGVSILAVLALVILSLLKKVDVAAISAFIVAQPLVLWLALAVVLAVTPIALYFVYSDE
jgi:hypothetical protein